MNISTKFQLHPPYGFWGEDFWIFFRKKFIWLIEDHSGNISVKLLSKYLQWDSSKCQFSFFPIISQWQLYVAIATRVLIRLGQKTIVFVPPSYRCYMWNMARIGFMASKEMSFENVDDERMDDDDDGRKTMPDFTISSPMSLWLRWENLCLKVGKKKKQWPKQRPMGHNAHLNVQLWRLYSAKIL